MPRLLRPYIPRDVRCRVAMRQLGELWPDAVLDAYRNRWGELHRMLLDQLAELLTCNREDLRLDHDPALENRRKRFTPRGPYEYVYEPDANDPEFLVYREKHAHHIKTNVRGDGAQYSDRALAQRERNRQKKKRPTKWPKRKLRSASRWPQGRTFWRG